MTELNLRIYRYFKAHKAVLYVLLLALIGLFIYFGSFITFEEDISKLLPSTHIGTSEQLAFENVKIKDKVFITFRNTQGEVDPYALSEVVDAYIDSLLVRDQEVKAIDNVLSRLDADMLPNLLDFVFAHVPSFIDSTDFERLCALVTPEHIEAQMAPNWEAVTGASGSFVMDMIRKDPIGIRDLFMAKSDELKGAMGGNFKVLNGHFFTPDSTVAVVFLSPLFNAFDSKSGVRLVEEMEQTIKQFETEHPQVEILFHGSPVHGVFNARRIKTDLVMTLGVSLLLVCLLICLCFRERNTLLLLIMPIIFGALFGLAAMYLIKGRMSLMALGIGGIILAVAFSYCIHVLTHFKYLNDPEKVIRDQTKPVILGCLTTIGAFLALLLTDSDLLRDFGLFATFGLVGTTLFSLVFLPQFLNTKKNRRSERAFESLARFNTYHFEQHKGLVAVLTVVFAVCIGFSGRVQFDSDLKNIGYHDPNVVRSREMLEQKTAEGCVTTYYAATSRDLDSAIRVSGQMADRLAVLHKEGTVSKYGQSGLFLLTKEEQQKRIDRWQAFWTPDKIAQVRSWVAKASKEAGFKPAFYDPFFALLEQTYEPASLIEANVLPSSLMANVVEKMGDHYMVFTSVQMKAPDVKAISDDLTGHIPHCVVIDPFYYTRDMVQLLHDDFNATVLISSLFVLVILIFSFKSLLLAVLAFLPMAVSWYTVLGVMAIFGIPFNLINIVISTFIFGVGVDYSIFMMTGLIAGTVKYDKLLLYHKTAVVFSAFALIVSISSLVFAKHQAMSSVGLVTLIGMTSAVLITYTLQPFLFHWLMRFPYARRMVQRAAPKNIQENEK